MAYLKFLIFLPAIFILAYDSSSSAFHMVFSAYKLNKQGDNIQPWMYSFPNFEPVCCSMVLIVASWPACRFIRRQVRWSHIAISLRIFHSFCDPHSERLSRSQWRSRCFSGTPLLSPLSINHGNLISGSSLKPSLYIWKFSVHVLLKPSLKDFEHYLASIWNDYDCIW